MSEIEWRPVVGFEDGYEVSNTGLVRSLDRVINRRVGPYRRKGALLKPWIDHNGAHYVTPRRAGIKPQRHLVGALVLGAFVGPRPTGLVCCHYDDDRANNYIENLRWDTQSANRFDAIRNGKDPFASRTKCVNGHEFTVENSYYNGHHRVCRPCRRRIKKQYQTRSKANAS